MPTTTVFLGTGSGFRLRRPPAVLNGFVSDIDPRVKAQLDTLHGLLSADVVARAAIGGGLAPVPAPPSASASVAEDVPFEDEFALPMEDPARPELQTNGKANPAQQGGLDPTAALPAGLTPQRARDPEKWAADSLAAQLNEELQSLIAAGELDATGHALNDALISLSEYVDRVPDLAGLKYSVDDAMASEWNTYSEPIRRVLDNDAYPALRVYLVAYAYVVLGFRDVGAVKNFILTDSLGASRLINYAAVGAARELVADNGYNIADFDVDNGEFVNRVKTANVGMSEVSFEPAVMTVVNDLINNVSHSALIDEAEKTLGPLPLATRQLLARYIDAAPVPVTAANVAGFATVWLAQIAPPPPAQPSATTTPSGGDFSIETYQDDPSSVQISRSSVLCAGQLYYTMVLGDELDVFSIVHYFTHKYLVSGLMEIVDQQLREDLQSYVFSGRFTDLKTGRLLDRSRPAERAMFYRQVFAHGRGQVPEDLIVNSDFPPMWKNLMLQSATYLERAQAALNPDGFVSKQQVAQAVEDLQYNLSTHCIGMATVATPLLHAELNFCIRRILMHPEVLSQVDPAHPTWWRVVERLYMDLKQTRPRSTVLYNKAKLGHDLIEAIANYDPGTFEDDANFSEFISNADAYITTQSILQAALSDDLKRRQEDSLHGHEMPDGPGGPPMSPNGAPMSPPLAGAPSGAAASTNGASPENHDWDF